MSTTPDWVLLVGGAGIGSALSAVATLLVARSNWRREDRHRFADVRREACLEFVTAASLMIELTQKVGFDPSKGLRVVPRAAIGLLRNGRAIDAAEARFVRAWQHLLLIGSQRMRETASDLAAIRDELTHGDAEATRGRLAAFLLVAQIELAPPPGGPIRRWKTQREAQRLEAEFQQELANRRSATTIADTTPTDPTLS